MPGWAPARLLKPAGAVLAMLHTTPIARRFGQQSHFSPGIRDRPQGFSPRAFRKHPPDSCMILRISPDRFVFYISSQRSRYSLSRRATKEVRHDLRAVSGHLDRVCLALFIVNRLLPPFGVGSA